jgi:hypothetical protein
MQAEHVVLWKKSAVAKNGGFSRHPQVHIRQGNDCHTTDGVVDQMGQLGIPIIADYLSDE